MAVSDSVPTPEACADRNLREPLDEPSRATEAMSSSLTPSSAKSDRFEVTGAVDKPAPNPVPDPAETSSARISEQLWHAVHARLSAFVAQRIDDPADVADLVQTVFLRAHQNVASLGDEQRLLSWLFQITRNAIADYYRSPARRREIGGVGPDGGLNLRGGDPTASTVPLGESAPNDLPVAASDDPSALRELAGCVRPLLQELPPVYRDALTLVEFDGMAQVEVASRLGISVSGMKSRVQRGRSMLRDGLMACCDISRSATGGVLDFAPKPATSCGADGSGATPAEPCQSIVPLQRGSSPRRARGAPGHRD